MNFTDIILRLTPNSRNSTVVLLGHRLLRILELRT